MRSTQKRFLGIRLKWLSCFLLSWKTNSEIIHSFHFIFLSFCVVRWSRWIIMGFRAGLGTMGDWALPSRFPQVCPLAPLEFCGGNRNYWAMAKSMFLVLESAVVFIRGALVERKYYYRHLLKPAFSGISEKCLEISDKFHGNWNPHSNPCKILRPALMVPINY